MDSSTKRANPRAFGIRRREGKEGKEGKEERKKGKEKSRGGRKIESLVGGVEI
jgi:hypothetical protein